MSEDKKYGLTRRRVLGGLATVGAASAAAGAGTMAYFSDQEAANNNTVSAGTLDLTNGNGEDKLTALSVSNAKPGDSGSQEFTLKNSGSITGYLDAWVASVNSSENGTNEPESKASGEGSGVELANQMTVTLSLGDGSGNYSQVLTGNPANFSTGEGSEFTSDNKMTSGQTRNFKVAYSIPTSAGNEIQSDSVSIDLALQLAQKMSQ